MPPPHTGTNAAGWLYLFFENVPWRQCCWIAKRLPVDCFLFFRGRKATTETEWQCYEARCEVANGARQMALPPAALPPMPQVDCFFSAWGWSTTTTVTQPVMLQVDCFSFSAVALKVASQFCQHLLDTWCQNCTIKNTAAGWLFFFSFDKMLPEKQWWCSKVFNAARCMALPLQKCRQQPCTLIVLNFIWCVCIKGPPPEKHFPQCQRLIF